MFRIVSEKSGTPADNKITKQASPAAVRAPVPPLKTDSLKTDPRFPRTGEYPVERIKHRNAPQDAAQNPS